jgi:hypothetical protein
MEIKIRKNGWNTGTVGWLSEGLDKGTLAIKESSMRENGNHGLWLKGPDGLSQYLAAYNQYGLSPSECQSAVQYLPADPEYREGIWTDAAWRTLMQIAEEWCAECNTERERDTQLSPGAITITRSEVAHV